MDVNHSPVRDPFGDLHLGQTFEDNTTIYIKTETVLLDGAKKNALGLNFGRFEFFQDDHPIEVVKFTAKRGI